MAEINSETVYDVALDVDELSDIAEGGTVGLDLPTGDVVRLSLNGQTGSVTTADITPSTDVAPDSDADLDEIEELVKEAEQEKRAARGDPEAEDEADADEAEAEADAGNPRRETNGMIEIERGGEVE